MCDVNRWLGEGEARTLFLFLLVYFRDIIVTQSWMLRSGRLVVRSKATSERSRGWVTGRFLELVLIVAITEEGSVIVVECGNCSLLW
jgi:hypothetical protein